jgi:hypothetical protein
MRQPRQTEGCCVAEGLRATQQSKTDTTNVDRARTPKQTVSGVSNASIVAAVDHGRQAGRQTDCWPASQPARQTDRQTESRIHTCSDACAASREPRHTSSAVAASAAAAGDAPPAATKRPSVTSSRPSSRWSRRCRSTGPWGSGPAQKPARSCAVHCSATGANLARHTAGMDRGSCMRDAHGRTHRTTALTHGLPAANLNPKP